MSYSTLKNVARGGILLCFLCYLLLIYFASSLRSEVADAVFKNVDSSVLVYQKLGNVRTNMLLNSLKFVKQKFL